MFQRTRILKRFFSEVKKPRNQFDWADPLLLSQNLSDDERLMSETAKAFCKDKLLPRVVTANR